MSAESQRNALAKIDSIDQAATVAINLRVTCKACGRTRVVPPSPLEGLARLRRWPLSLIALSGKLRCSTCNSRSVELKVTSDTVDGPAIGPTNGREWQALVRRLRS
jgi:hypothetical protein